MRNFYEDPRRDFILVLGCYYNIFIVKTPVVRTTDTGFFLNERYAISSFTLRQVLFLVVSFLKKRKERQ